jgi:hypothetical protein
MVSDALLVVTFLVMMVSDALLVVTFLVMMVSDALLVVTLVSGVALRRHPAVSTQKKNTKSYIYVDETCGRYTSYPTPQGAL